MQIRLARQEKIPAVMEVVRRVVPLMQAEDNQQWDESYPNEAIFAADIGKRQLWVAEIDHVIAGVIAISTDQEPEYAEVGWDLKEVAVVPHRLAVDPAFRGAGIGAALMRKVDEVAADQGISIVRVDTNSSNIAMQRMFPKLGYSYAGEVELGFRPGLKFLCYEKRIL